MKTKLTLIASTLLLASTLSADVPWSNCNQPWPPPPPVCPSVAVAPAHFSPMQAVWGQLAPLLRLFV